jgi:DNA-binding response OmpR family regulator
LLAVDIYARGKGGVAVRSWKVDVPGAGCQAEDRKKALDAGFDLHLTKPVEPARLQALIEGP